MSLERFRLLCVVSQILGNRTFSRHLCDAIDRLPDIDPTYITIAAEDFATYQAPGWLRVSSLLEAQWVVRRKVEATGTTGIDGILVNAWEFSLGLRKFARSMPFAVSLDTTPRRLSAALWARPQSRLATLRSRLSLSLAEREFRTLLPWLDVFLPQSEWCGESLRSEYGVAPDRCFVTFCPQPLTIWRPLPASRRARCQLLFVGNDFDRKGGRFLLELFDKHLADFCTLHIASNDPSLDGARLPPTATLYRGLDTEALLPLYQASDFLVLPTRIDQLPNVISEACAVGLPCAATDVGGIRDLVRDGESGLLFPIDAPPASWAFRIRELWHDPARHEQLRRNARALAERYLNFEDFSRTVGRSIARLRSSRATAPRAGSAVTANQSSGSSRRTPG